MFIHERHEKVCRYLHFICDLKLSCSCVMHSEKEVDPSFETYCVSARWKLMSRCRVCSSSWQTRRLSSTRCPREYCYNNGSI